MLSSVKLINKLLRDIVRAIYTVQIYKQGYNGVFFYITFFLSCHSQ